MTIASQSQNVRIVHFNCICYICENQNKTRLRSAHFIKLKLQNGWTFTCSRISVLSVCLADTYIHTCPGRVFKRFTLFLSFEVFVSLPVLVCSGCTLLFCVWRGAVLPRRLQRTQVETTRRACSENGRLSGARELLHINVCQCECSASEFTYVALSLHDGMDRVCVLASHRPRVVTIQPIEQLPAWGQSWEKNTCAHTPAR